MENHSESARQENPLTKFWTALDSADRGFFKGLLLGAMVIAGPVFTLQIIAAMTGMSLHLQ